MPVDDATSAETAPITAAAPLDSMSAQLQERLEREQRMAAITRQREYREILGNLEELCTAIRVIYESGRRG